jgi:hypothetical protein
MPRYFVVRLGSSPFKYLGVPLHYDKLRREDLQPIIDKIMKRIAGWKGKLLSYGARLTLLKACLASIPIYLMSFIKFPKWVIEAINSQMANFFWNDQENNHKYHLSNIHSLCLKKEHGGLGIPDLRNLNLCLLGAWVQRYQESDNKLWKNIIDSKYQTCSPNILCCHDRNASPFWKGFMWAAQAARLGVKWHVGDGRRVRFWEDQWFGSCSLAIQYWNLYSIINEQGCTIREAWDGTNLKFTFRRTVNRRVMLLWQELLQIASEICFSEEPDQMIWQFSSTGRYSVQTLYAVVNDRGVRQIFTPVVWKIKVPPRIHIFLWLFARNKLLTRDNLAKRRKLDDQSCLFCSDNESVHHLFFYCCVARQMWYNIAEILELPVGQKFESIA